MNTLLDKLKELNEKATPRPWAYTQCADICEIVYESNTKTSGPFSEQDARLVCTMRAYLPDIIALLKAGEAMYKDLDDNEAGYTSGQAAWDAALNEEDV